jgi:phage-related protein (TIGR01555 family)
MTTPFTLELSQPAAEQRIDGWLNVFTGMGVIGKDKAAGTSFGGATRLDPITLEDMFTGDAIAAKIVTTPADDMTRAWIEFRHGDDADAGAAVTQALQDINAQPLLKEAIQWSDLFGGALVVLGINDGQPATHAVNMDAIQSVEIISVLDRWQCFPETYYQDANDIKFGKVQTYRLMPISTMTFGFATIVHESRVLRFEGAMLPPRQRLRNWGWGDSVLNRVYDVIRDYQGSHATLPTIIQEFIQTTYQLKGLAALLTQGGADATAKVVNRLQAMQLGKSIFRASLLDENETSERTSLSVTGLADLIDRIERRLVASTDGIPHNILLGEAPGHKGSLNSGGGQGEMRAWYDKVSARQNSQLRPQLLRLIELMMRAKKGPTKGVMPDSWSFEFCSLWQPDAKAEADAKLVQAQADALYLDRDVLSSGEVARSRFGGTGYSADTVLDMEARNAQGALEADDDESEHEPDPAIAAKPGTETDPPEDT